jgi:hypothetical protein
MQFPLQRAAWWKQEFDFKGQELLEKRVWEQDRARLQNTFLFRRVSRTFFRGLVPSRFERWVTKAYPKSARLNLIFLPGNDLSKLRLILEKLEVFLRPWSERDRLLVVKPGSSLPMVVLLAVRLGYEQILLAGCDLNSGRHFYDEPGFQNRYDPESQTGLFNIDQGSFNTKGLVTEGRSSSPVDDLVRIAEYLDERKMAKIFLINDDSLYCPRLSVFSNEPQR